jgi:two-component system, NtrC family, sensor kinase
VNTDRNVLAAPPEEDIDAYRPAFFASPDIITFSRLADGVYLDVNPVFERFTGLRREDVIGRSSLEINFWVNPEDRKRFVAEMLEKGELHGFQTRLRNGKGETRDVECSAAIYDRDGEKMLVGVIRDVTARKRDEDELRRYRDELASLVEQRTGELQQAHDQLLQSEKMASIGQLAAGVAHEINNPIGFVNSNLGSLATYFQDLLELIDAYARNDDLLSPFPQRLQALEAVKRRIDFDFLRQDVAALLAESRDGMLRVKKIVQDLKEFSHVGAAEWQWANLHAGIDSTLNIVNNEVKYKATVHKEYGPLPDIECLPLELNQVFMNMLVNAAQAIQEAGEIRIRTGVGTGEDSGKVWVEFRDNGPGISPDNLKRIFDPFFTTKPVGKGTGLGLSLSYGIVQKHQGRIDVDSTVGAGTCFRIWLPVTQGVPRDATP